MFIDVYDRAADELPRLIEELHTEFQHNVFDHENRIHQFWKDFENEFFGKLYEHYENHGTREGLGDLVTNPTDIRWQFSRSGKLHLKFNLWLFSHPASLGTIINQNNFCRDLMARLLKDYYGYEGDFVLENDPEREKEYRDRYNLG